MESKLLLASSMLFLAVTKAV